MGEPGEIDIRGSSPNLEISDAKARLFIQSLPSEGIMLHGASTEDIPDVKKLGLSPLGRNAHLYPKPGRSMERLSSVIAGKDSGNFVFYFFLKVNDNPSFDEYSPNETKKIINALRLSINETVFYGDDRHGNNMPAALILGKKPSNGLLFGGDHRPSTISRVKGALPIGASRLTIPNKDIITILTSGNSMVRRKERVEDLLGKVVNAVIEWKNFKAQPAGNPLRKIATKFLK